MDVIFFFFSSRRRHTRYWRDWSSDVCSSDLRSVGETLGMEEDEKIRILVADDHPMLREGLVAVLGTQPDFEVVGEAGDGPNRESVGVGKRVGLGGRPDLKQKKLYIRQWYGGL